MELWISHGNAGKQTVVSVVCSVLGLCLVTAFRDFSGAGTNAMAGCLLGVLLLLIGVVGFLVSGKQTVVVDPGTRRITIEDSNRFGTKSRSIPFDAVVSVSVGYLGKKSNLVTWYYLVLRLSSGEEYPLFSPGRFFEGGSDRSIVEGWRRRLEEYLGPHGGAAPADTARRHG
ncbi:MAG: hypothetical protein NTW68_01855 [candidate division NC10 bacterium]|nr:hypothetical protein [candidate division NC10 bacterium]